MKDWLESLSESDFLALVAYIEALKKGMGQESAMKMAQAVIVLKRLEDKCLQKGH